MTSAEPASANLSAAPRGAAPGATGRQAWERSSAHRAGLDRVPHQSRLQRHVCRPGSAPVEDLGSIRAVVARLGAPRARVVPVSGPASRGDLSAGGAGSAPWAGSAAAGGEVVCCAETAPTLASTSSDATPVTATLFMAETPFAPIAAAARTGEDRGWFPRPLGGRGGERFSASRTRRRGSAPSAPGRARPRAPARAPSSPPSCCGPPRCSRAPRARDS